MKSITQKLVGRHLLASLALVGWMRFVLHPDDDGYLVSVAALVGLVVSQAGLLALWAIFSHGRRWVRCCGAVAGALLVSSQMIAVVDDWGQAREFIGIAIWIGAPMLVVSICALFLRQWGVEVVGADEFRPNTMREGVRFSIGQILCLTSLIGLLLAIVRALHGLDDAESAASAVLVATLIGVLFGGQTLASLWAMLGLGRPWLRSALPLMLAAASAALIHLSTHDPADRYWVYIGTTEWETIIVLISLLVVRRAGYRIIRPQGTDV
ncbi:MAG TPA: hypothetical protein VHC22_34250 [Pirellulales bacterium]|nr:hypothetical protein [Pirellulales bacterium]